MIGESSSVSVIIPTYNRKDSLLRTLDSLSRQTYPAERLEVIVVDDGGNDGTEAVTYPSFPFALRYLRQDNRGATAARNSGASHSSGQILVFIDDDIRLYPLTLERLVNETSRHEQTIVLGTLILPEEIMARSIFAGISGQDYQAAGEDLDFTNCMTGLLAIRSENYYNLGGFQDPTGGWPNWDDVDFGYRAHQRGMKLARLSNAKAEHWDYAAVNLHIACQRWEAAAESAPRLFLHYPNLFAEVPMFHDKGPVAFSSDSAIMIMRKITRKAASSPPARSALEFMVRLLEKIYPRPDLLASLYRWIVGGYIYRGYRRGLKEVRSLSAPVTPAPAKNE